MILFKGGVKTIPLLEILVSVANAYDELGLDCVITSANDSKHMTGSKHYKDEALDFRTRTIPRDKLQGFLDRVKFKLNIPASGYFAQLEHVGKPNEHLHIELDS